VIKSAYEFLYFVEQGPQSRPRVVMDTAGSAANLAHKTVKGKCVLVRFTYVYRWAAVLTTGCLGDRFELMSLWGDSQADTGTRLCHGTQSSPRSPGHSQCPLGFHSDQLKEKHTGLRFGYICHGTHFLYSNDSSALTSQVLSFLWTFTFSSVMPCKCTFNISFLVSQIPNYVSYFAH